MTTQAQYATRMEERELKGEWIANRPSVPYFEKEFAQSPINIRDIIIRMNHSVRGDRQWPKVSWATDIPEWMLNEMLDAQYPDPNNPMRTIKKRAYGFNAPVPIQRGTISILRETDNLPLSLSREDLHKLNIATKEYFNNFELNDYFEIFRDQLPPELQNSHDIDSPPPIVPDTRLEKDKFKDIFNEYDITEMMAHINVHQRSAMSKLVFDRVIPTVYCILWAYVQRRKKDWQCLSFSLPQDDFDDMRLLQSNRHKAYAEKNISKIRHWREPRKLLGLNDQMLCRLLRIAPSTLARWDAGYRAPANIRLFFELFCQFPVDFVTLLIRIQDEIADNLTMKLRSAFTHLDIAYPSSHLPWPPACSLEALQAAVHSSRAYHPRPDSEAAQDKPDAHSGHARPVDSLHIRPIKPRRYMGRIVAPKKPSLDVSGNFTVVRPTVRTKSGSLTLDQFKIYGGEAKSLAQDFPTLTKAEFTHMRIIAGMNLPEIVRMK